jgi:hypothetical protein
MHNEDAGVGWPVAMVGGIDRRTKKRGLATVNGLERIAAHLCEQRIGFDLDGNGLAFELEHRCHASAPVRQLLSHGFPECSVGAPHLRQIVHR